VAYPASYLYFPSLPLLFTLLFNHFTYIFPILSGTSPPGTYNPLEVLPTRLGLSMRTADNTSGTPCMNVTSNTHLGPGPSSNSGTEERHASASTEVTAKPQSQPGPSKPVSEDVSTSKEQLPFHGYTLSILIIPFSSFVMPEIF
jgi:hypothetical protein